jgi:flagellar biosynthetic protein FlhB
VAEEKPFEPTPSRLEKARREGDRPRSQEIVAVAALSSAAAMALGGAGIGASAMREALASAAASAEGMRDGTVLVTAQPWLAYGVVALYALSVPVASFCGAIVATYVQTGGLTFKPPAPNLGKLNPFEGLKKLFGRDAFVAGTKAFVVACAVGAATVPSLHDAFARSSTTATPEALADLVRAAIVAACGVALGVSAIFGALDALLERIKWRRRLRMTFEEVKRDHKESEGDPLQRGRRRATHAALVRGSIGKVREAAFVVTNPTHVAIALEYRPPDVPVPRVLVRAVDAGALAVRAMARDHDVPIVEDVALARALLATTEVGDFIPPDTYGAIAQIVADLVRSGALASEAA